MKIALIIRRFDAYGGGAERWTAWHAAALLRAGHDVHIVAQRIQHLPTGAIGHLLPERSRGGWRHWRWRARLHFAHTAERFLDQHQFDMVHDMGDGWRADIFMPHHGTRLAGLEQNLHRLSPPLRLLRHWLQPWLPRYREFAELERRQYEPQPQKRFVAISRMVQQHMQQYHQVPESAIRIVYNGVDTNRFHPRQSIEELSQREHLRRELALTDSTVYLLVAHNFWLKGLDAMLHALARLRRQKHPATVVVVGAGNIPLYRRLAQRLGVEPWVRFVGNQVDPLAYYHLADVYVQPTYYDPCSLVVLEALACGLPIITTRCNGASELLSRREGVVLDNPQDVIGLADAMALYLDSHPRRLASQSARLLAQRHSLKRQTQALLQLYQEKWSWSVDAA